MRLFLAVVLTICFLQPSYGQKDLTQDSEFFQKQAKAYDNWLKSSGLGEILMVQDLEIKSNSLSLYLQFSNTNIDYVVSAWEKIKTTFDESHPISLEEHLFYKAVYYMRVAQNEMDVQLYDTYDLTKEPLFFRGIYFSEGKVSIASSNPRSLIDEISIPRINLDKTVREEVSLDLAVEKAYIYRKILKSAQSYYEAEDKKIDGRIPVFTPLEQQENLRFEVSDLTREVVVGQSIEIVCPLIRLLGYDCNWSPREVLTFTITYKSKNQNSILLEIELDGRIGSGVYAHASRSSYVNLELEHKLALERYLLTMKNKIYNWLTRP